MVAVPDKVSPTVVPPKSQPPDPLVISSIAVSARTFMVAVKVFAESCGSLLKTLIVFDKDVSDEKDDALNVRVMLPESPAAIADGAVAESQDVTTYVPGVCLIVTSSINQPARWMLLSEVSLKRILTLCPA